MEIEIASLRLASAWSSAALAKTERELTALKGETLSDPFALTIAIRELIFEHLDDFGSLPSWSETLTRMSVRFGVSEEAANEILNAVYLDADSGIESRLKPNPLRPHDKRDWFFAVQEEYLDRERIKRRIESQPMPGMPSLPQQGARS